MTTDSGLRELVANWRRDANYAAEASKNKELAEWVRDRHHARAGALNGCAKELESILTAAGEANPTAPAGMVLVPRPMETAPKDGRLLRLLVAFTNHAIDDSIAPVWTIGSNTFDNHGDEDEWKFAGWSWEQDCFTQGEGTPVGWLPWDAAAPAAQVAVPVCSSCRGKGYTDGYGADGSYDAVPCGDCAPAAAPAVVVDEAMVKRALDAQPYAEANNDATRVWQFFNDWDSAFEVMDFAIAAALKGKA